MQRNPRVRLGVIGWPVRHSRSPLIQNAALQAAGLHDWRYQLLPAAPGVFSELIGGLPGAGFRGVNVTIPHKQQALAAASRASDRGLAIGAANVLLFESDGSVVADNTDAPALISALPIPVAGATTLVLGAGGSARAAVWALLDAGAREVRVWNRTTERARELCEQIGGTPVKAADPADFLINCTSSGLNASDSILKDLPLSADSLSGYRCVVDLPYRAAETPLIRAARAHSIPAVDGFELLVLQGALSFEQFTGTSAPIEAMRAALRGCE